MRGFWLVLLSVIAITPANADWLANAWPEDAIPKNGNPAITFSTTGTITLVLPQAVLGEAYAAGLSTRSRRFSGAVRPQDLFKSARHDRPSYQPQGRPFD